jgi:hypothetical protein
MDSIDSVGEAVGKVTAWFQRVVTKPFPFMQEGGSYWCVPPTSKATAPEGGFDLSSQSGVYVWFWRSSANSYAWPLYVGMTRCRGGFRSRHLTGHLAKAKNSTDMLCSPIASREKGRLMMFDKNGTSDCWMARCPKENIEGRMKDQFGEASILLLPVKVDDGLDLRVAEGVMLAAAESIHLRHSGPAEESLVRMMNSRGRATSLGLGFEKLARREQVIELGSILEGRLESSG